MKRLILSLLTPMILLSSCNEPMEIKDWSFEISSIASFNEQDMKSTLFLRLDKGCPEQTYKISYTIDDDPSKSGMEQIKFDDAFSASINLPELEIGDHRIMLDYSTDNYQQHDECALKVTTGGFKVHAEVDTGSSTCSALLVSLIQGRSTELYRIKVMIDDELIAQQDDIDFEKTPIASIPFPLIRPGGHSATVVVSDGRSTKEMQLEFTEPIRHPDLDIVVERSPTTGKTRFKITANPYDLTVSVYDSLVVKGRCDYVKCTPVVGQTENKTDYKELCDVVKLDRFLPVIGKWYDLTDAKTRESLIAAMSQANFAWDQRWDSSSEGGWEYFETPTGLSYYKIVSSTHHMNVDFEIISGITVNVTNSERDVIWNKKPISVKYSYKL